MDKIAGYDFEYRGRKYEFEISYEPDRLADADGSYRLTARSSDSASGRTIQEENVDILLHWDSGRTTVLHKDREAFDVPPDVSPPSDDPDTGWIDFIAEHFNDSDPIEAIIDSIPPIDPVIGCIIRGSLSATVDQIIRCWRENREVGGGWERVRVIARCLGNNFLRITGTAMWRIGKCVIKLGF